MTLSELQDLPRSESCRVLDFEEAEVYPAEPPGSPVLVVRGTAPCLNMDVSLVPRIYIRCPEHWGIEVVGCLTGGVCVTAVKKYEVTLSLAGVIGSKGIEVIGATDTETIDVSGGCRGGGL